MLLLRRVRDMRESFRKKNGKAEGREKLSPPRAAAEGF